MINSSLVEILKSFSKDELKEFDDMVSSEFFNRKSAVVKFWKVILKHAPDFNSKGMSREEVYSKIFPGKDFNYGTMKNLIHDLTKLAENFIEFKVYQTRTTQRKLYQLEGYLERGLGRIFEKELVRAEGILEENKAETGYHGSRYHLETLKQNFLIVQDKHYQIADIINSANRYLTLGYFIQIIENNYNGLFMQQEIKVSGRNDFLEKVLAFIKRNPVEMDYVTRVYYNAFMLVYDGSTEYFYSLKELLEDNTGGLSVERKYNFFVALANYCLNKVDTGLMEFIKIEYEIYRFMIDNNIYSIDLVKNMDGAFYKNVSGTAVRAGELKWAKDFIENYKEMLEPDVRENYYFHALIEYYIKLKKFDEAQGYLSRIKHTNHTSKLNIKGWEIITAYELDHLEELRYLIDSARHFIQNDKKIVSSRLDRLSNFLSFVTKLVHLKENPENIKSIKRELSTLKEDLNKLRSFHRIWLEEKIEELGVN